LKSKELIAALTKKLGTTSKRELAKTLGITEQTLHAWQRTEEDLSPLQLANALSKARDAAVAKSQLQTIRPIVEIFPIKATKRKVAWDVFRGESDSSGYEQGLKHALQSVNGIYVFYDSRGDALYAGKAKLQPIWKEMNLAFNRKRGEVQAIMLVDHPVSSNTFSPAHEKSRQPKPTQLYLREIAHYFSAYEVDVGMIDDVEALLVRAFPNNLLNIKMERFTADRTQRKQRKLIRQKTAAQG